MNYRKLRRDITNKHWDNWNPKVQRVINKLWTKIHDKEPPQLIVRCSADQQYLCE